MLLFLILSACSRMEDASNKIRLDYYFNGTPVTIRNERQIIEWFEREHPDIDIIMTALPWVQYFQKLQISFVSGDPPDVFWGSTAWTTDLVKSNLLLDLDPFIERFGFYLDSLDRVFELQSRIGLETPALTALAEEEQARFKTYLFLQEACNTTGTGALRLFVGNFYSDAFALLRMIYEAAALMHYGNASPENASEVYRTIFKSDLDDAAHSKGEWALIRKAESRFEDEKPDLVPLRQYINNFGAHISRAKIVLGNVGTAGNQAASSVFRSNFGKAEYLMGLDMLHGLLMLVLEEYDRQAALHQGALPSVAGEIAAHNQQFVEEIRPQLQTLQAN